MTLALRGEALEASSDRREWKPLVCKKESDKVVATIAVKSLSGEGKLYLRVR